MFFFVWTNDGGALQYIGLVLFLLQASLVAFPSLHQALSQHACLLGCLVGFTPVLYLLYRIRRNDLSLGQIYHLTVQRLGAAIDSSYVLHVARNANADGFSLLCAGLLVWCAVAAVQVCELMSSSSLSGSFLMGLCLLVALGFSVASLIIVLGWQAAADGRGRARAQSGASLSEIITVVASMPVEEYVPDTKDSYGKCSVSQLKKMLEVRETCVPSTGTTSSAAPRDFVERGELVEAVRQCRKSNDSCIICLEEYNAGDPIRVLPKCGHEFHVECVDQWAYTCASSANRHKQNPSCPLCKVALK